MSFMTDEEKRKFGDLEEILTRVYNMAVEHTLLQVPNLMGGLFKMSAKVDKLKKEFFANNKDISKDIIRPIFKDVEEAHPEWSPEKIIEEASRRYRSQTALKSSIGEI